MTRSDAGSNGNGDDEPGALASVITLPKKRSGKGESVALGEAPKRMIEVVIPGGSLFSRPNAVDPGREAERFFRLRG